MLSCLDCGSRHREPPILGLGDPEWPRSRRSSNGLERAKYALGQRIEGVCLSLEDGAARRCDPRTGRPIAPCRTRRWKGYDSVSSFSKVRRCADGMCARSRWKMDLGSVLVLSLETASRVASIFLIISSPAAALSSCGGMRAHTACSRHLVTSRTASRSLCVSGTGSTYSDFQRSRNLRARLLIGTPPLEHPPVFLRTAKLDTVTELSRPIVKMMVLRVAPNEAMTAR